MENDTKEEIDRQTQFAISVISKYTSAIYQENRARARWLSVESACIAMNEAFKMRSIANGRGTQFNEPYNR